MYTPILYHINSIWIGYIENTYIELNGKSEKELIYEVGQN